MSLRLKPVDVHSDLPLASQVEQALRDAIEGGRFRRDNRLPTVRHLSEQFQVSKSTVSNAIACLVKSGILAAKQGRGTFVVGKAAEQAQALTVGNLGLYWDGAKSLGDEDRYYLEIYQGLGDAASHHGCHLIMLSGTGHEASAVERVAALRSSSSLAGVLYLVTRFVDQDVVKGIQELGLPVVLVDGLEDSMTTDSIMLDNDGGIREAMAELLSLGHRRIAYIAGLTDSPSSVERLDAYKRALKEAGLSYSQELVMRICPGIDDGRKALVRLLAEEPTAILTFNTLLAEGVMLEAQSRGIAIPEDLSLIAFGGSMRRVDPGGPSSVVLDLEEMTKAAVQALLERIAGDEHPPRRIPVRTFLRDSGTVGPPRR